MQCKNCGRQAREHRATDYACPTKGKPSEQDAPKYHETQRFKMHKQCPHKHDGLCGKAGPCFSRSA